MYLYLQKLAQCKTALTIKLQHNVQELSQYEKNKFGLPIYSDTIVEKHVSSTP